MTIDKSMVDDKVFLLKTDCKVLFWAAIPLNSNESILK